MRKMNKMERFMKYREDFPKYGTHNWVIVRLKNIDRYYDGSTWGGILLHDGKFIVEGTIFNENEFDIEEEETKYMRVEMMGLPEKYK